MISSFQVFSVEFPACSQLRTRDVAVVPGVPLSTVSLCTNSRRVAKYRTKGERGNSGNTPANERIGCGT
jgi:hypothetical protein